jgi:hypothetical protein
VQPEATSARIVVLEQEPLAVVVVADVALVVVVVDAVCLVVVNDIVVVETGLVVVAAEVDGVFWQLTF